MCVDIYTCGKKDALSFHNTGAAIQERASHLLRACELPVCLDIFHTVLLEEHFDALGQRAYGLFLGCHHGGQVCADVISKDTAILKFVCGNMIQMRIV